MGKDPIHWPSKTFWTDLISDSITLDFESDSSGKLRSRSISLRAVPCWRLASLGRGQGATAVKPVPSPARVADQPTETSAASLSWA